MPQAVADDPIPSTSSLHTTHTRRVTAGARDTQAAAEACPPARNGAPAAAASHGRIGTGRQPSLSLSRVARSSARRRPGALNTVLAGARYVWRVPGAAQPAQGAQGDAPRRASAKTEAFGRRGLVMQHLLPLGLRGDERPRRRRGSGQAHGVVAGTDRLSARPVSISSAWATAELRRRHISAPLGSSGRFEKRPIVCDYCD